MEQTQYLKFNTPSPSGIDNLDDSKFWNDNPKIIENEFMERGANVKWFGAKGDGIANDTLAIQAAINHVNSLGGGTVLFGEGLFIVDTLTVYPKIFLVGQGKNATRLQKLSKDSGGTDSVLITGVDIQYFSIRDLTILHQTGATTSAGGFIRFETSISTNVTSHILVENCIMSDTSNGRGDLIVFTGLVRDIHILNNKFTGYTNTVTDYKTSLLKVDNIGLFHNVDDTVFVRGNLFRYCKQGVVFEGSGYPPSVIFTDNVVHGQTDRGLMIYHGLNWIVSNNNFRDITAPKRSNNDGGAVWLDVYAGDVMHKSNVFANNTIHDIVGNAVFLDSFNGIVANNEITNVSKRTNDTFSNTYTYESVTSTHTSDGGHGIHFGGSCENFLITGNKIRNCEQAGIYGNRALDIHQNYYVSGTIEGNDIQANSNGIEIHEKISEIHIKNNHIQATTNGIRIHRIHNTTGNVLGAAYITGNTIQSLNGINKTYDYGYGYILGNMVERDSTGFALAWGFNQGSTSGNMNINKTDRTVATF